MQLTYFTFKNAEKIPTHLIKAFLINFHLRSPEEVNSLTRNQLVEQLKSVELKRRPRRAFQVVFGLEKQFFPPFFSKEDFEKSNYINKSSVETPKKYENAKEYPYRCLLISPTLLRKFFKEVSSCTNLLETVLNLRIPDNNTFSLFVPSKFHLDKYVIFENNIFNRIKEIPDKLFESTFGTSPNPEAFQKRSDGLPVKTEVNPQANLSRPQTAPPPTPTTQPSPAAQPPKSDLNSSVQSETQQVTQQETQNFPPPPQSFFQSEKSKTGFNSETNFNPSAQNISQQDTDNKPKSAQNSEPILNFDFFDSSSYSQPPSANLNSPLITASQQVPESQPSTSQTSPGSDIKSEMTHSADPNLISEVTRRVTQQVMTSLNNPNEQNSALDTWSNNLATTGFKAGYNLPLKGLWNPDSDDGSSIEEIISLLRLVKKRRQYRSDESLICAFLAENKLVKYLLRLSEDEKTNLESFILWLRNFKVEDDLGFYHRFMNTKQNNLSFRSFAMELERLYRGAKKIPQDKSLEDHQWDEIAIVFRRNLRDPRIKDKLTSLPRKTPFQELISHCEYIRSNLRDMFAHSDESTPITSTVQMAATPNPDLKSSILSELKSDISSELAKQFKCFFSASQQASTQAKPAYVSKQAAPQPSRNDIFCKRCQVEGHSEKDCAKAHTDQQVGTRPFCIYCKKIGHRMDSCWKLHGRPQNMSRPNQQYRRNKSDNKRPDNRTNTVANFLQSEFSPLDVYQEN